MGTVTADANASIDHQAFRDQIGEYLDGSLAQADRERFERHLVSCQSCGPLARTLGWTVELARHLPRRRMPPEARERLRQLLLGETARPL